MTGLFINGLIIALVVSTGTYAKKAPQQTEPRPVNVRRPCCCIDDVMAIDLLSSTSKPPNIEGVEVKEHRVHNPKDERCDSTILLKANFERKKHDCCCDDKQRVQCGRRMLQVDMYLGWARGGYIFNGGDSVSNNGDGGDGQDQEHDAEVQAKNAIFTMFKSDKCFGNATYATTFAGQLTNTVNRVTLFISNGYVRIQTDQGMDEDLCHDCFYALCGQSDSGPNNPGPNEDVYVALNRVIKATPAKTGYGVCSATVQWVCPSCEHVAHKGYW